MSEKDPARVGELVWTDALLAQFWSYYATHRQKDYFTSQYGQRIVQVTARFIDDGSLVCDFGCGAGHLLDKLLPRVRAAGCDFVASNVKATEARVGQAKNLIGVYLSTDRQLSDEFFDVLYLVETVEHLLEAQVAPTMRDVWRLLKPKGKIIVTTPHREDLEGALVYCPTCSHTFHRWQHVRSFSEADLVTFMRKAGFDPITVFTTDFGASGIIQRLKSRFRPFFGRKNPHLVYIGRRR